MQVYPIQAGVRFRIRAAQKPFRFRVGRSCRAAPPRSSAPLLPLPQALQILLKKDLSGKEPKTYKVLPDLKFPH